MKLNEIKTFIDRQISRRRVRPADRESTIAMLQGMNAQSQFSEGYGRSLALQTMLDRLADGPELWSEEQNDDARVRAKAKTMGYDLNRADQFEESYGMAVEVLGISY